MVSIDKVVNVNLDIIPGTSAIGQYDTVAYIVPSSISNVNTLVGKRFTSLSEYTNIVDKQPIVGVDSGVELFFNNGGEAIILYTLDTTDDETSIQSKFETLVQQIITDSENNSYGLIYIVLSTLFGIGTVSNSSISTEDLISMDTYLQNLKAPYSKRLAVTCPLYTILGEEPEQQELVINSIKNDLSTTNIAIFYTNLIVSNSAWNVTTNPYIDEALLLGSFTTQLDLDGTESIRDFCYTPANISGYLLNGGASTYDEIPNDDSSYSSLISNVNVVSKIGNRTIIFGGNLANGVGIDTDFGCICVENDIANTLVEVMIQKQYLTALGLTNVLGKIENLLLRYQTNGYVELNSNYTGDTVYRTYNGTRYTIITNGTALPKGYLVTSVPMNNISQQDRQDRRFTPIYVIIQTQKGARVVEVSGSIA